jgi:hypothetical protein
MRPSQLQGAALAAAALVLLAGCSDDSPCSVCDRLYSASEPFEHALALTGQTRVELLGINGPVDVAGWAEDDSLRVWGTREVTSSTLADAQDHLEDLQVVVTVEETYVLIETQQPPKSDGRTYEVTYHLLVPLAMDVAFETINGDASAGGLAGSLHAALVNGNFAAEDLTGSLRADLVNGSVALENVSGNVTATAVNGSITANLAVPAGGTCRLSNVNGSIALAIPTGTSAHVSAQTTSGTITLQGLQFTSLTTTATTAEGTLGEGGGAMITLRTVNGSILLQGR